MPYEIQGKNCLISTDKNKMNARDIHHYLVEKCYWAKELPWERFLTAFNHSLCYVISINDQSIGFARVVTDYSETASLWDVFIKEPWQGKGYGRTLLNAIFSNPETNNVFKWFLMTQDAHALYKKFGFEICDSPLVMTKLQPCNF